MKAKKNLCRVIADRQKLICTEDALYISSRHTADELTMKAEPPHLASVTNSHQNVTLSDWI